MGKIDDIIRENGLIPKDCAYHTRRAIEKGFVRALVVKGETVNNIEYKCPFCGFEGFKQEEWVKASKAAKIKFRFKCEKCEKTIKVGKLKGKK